jgi:flagellar hook-associated protein 1 FlgK
MSLQALNTALTGLRAAQQQLNVISNNVANVGTPGYTRKILPQSTRTLDSGQGIGVVTNSIVRKVNMNLSRDLWTQVSSVSASSVKASYLSSIEAFHGPPDKELSISAYIAELKNQFVKLADDPTNGFLLHSTLNQAQNVAGKFNDFGKLVTQMRRDAQEEIVTSVGTINAMSEQIALLNTQIKNALSVGRSSADLEDRRDEALKALSQELQITYFTRGDGVVVVQSATGVELAAEQASPLSFSPTTITPTTVYPNSLAGIYTNGNASDPAAFDIAQTNLGGKLGALLELRDETLVEYQAQIDELAHKLASRLDAQGLRLFTDASGTIPPDTPPNPNGAPPTSVSYIGFSTNIRVNSDIVDNINLLQQGTYTPDTPIPTGSDVVLRRVLDFAFGTVNYQQAAGTIDLNIGLPATDLQQWLGIQSSNEISGQVNLGIYPEIDDGIPGNDLDLSDLLADLFPTWPNDDQVDITFTDPRTGELPVTITLDLSDAAAQAGPGINDALDQIIAEINAQITAQAVPTRFEAVASRGAQGQLVLFSHSNIEINASNAGGMGADALEGLGLSEGTFTTNDPYFDVQVEDAEPVRVYVEPGDTVNDLIDKMRWDPIAETGIPGLNVSFDPITGFLTLRPGIDDSNGGPSHGGNLRLFSGSFNTDSPVNADLAALPGSVNILGALFGSYTVNGGTVTEVPSVTDVLYGSETTVGSGIYVPYRNQYLGAGVNADTNILTATGLIDYGQKVISRQTQDLVIAQSKESDETTLRDLLQRRMTDESAVNIDEEMSNLIVIQTAYSAAARAVTAADEMFQELLNSFR